MITMTPGDRAHIDRLVAEGNEDLSLVLGNVHEALAARDEADVFMEVMAAIRDEDPLRVRGLLGVALMRLAKESGR